MRKKPIVFLTLTVLLLGGVAGVVVAALKHEPGFYRRCAIDAGADRTKQSDDFMKQFFALLNRVYDTRRGKWTFNFTQEQINSYFEEDFVRLKDSEALARLGIHAPRVHLEKDSMRVAFRYGSGFWSTVLTYEVKVWLVPSEANTLAVEILHRKAGGLPIAAQSLLNDFKELARNKNVDVSWYRNHGNPVAVIRFPSNRTRPNAQLSRFEVVNGQLTIEGQSYEPAQQNGPTPAE
jgi:hypothetical protein